MTLPGDDGIRAAVRRVAELDPAQVPAGDMPGDRIHIGGGHIIRAEAAAPALLDLVRATGDRRVVVSVFGGSGVGKSEVGSILTHVCRGVGIGTYLLSGDNYPHRCPPDNDDERLAVYRAGGWSSMARDPGFQAAWNADVHRLIADGVDADVARGDDHPGVAAYQRGGEVALRGYLGTQREIDFDLVNAIIARFRAGARAIPLKRMGRTATDVRFDVVDLSQTRLLVIEWTHGNSAHLKGVDGAIMLYSTPEETAAHRRARARDRGTDSPFVQQVLRIEQELVNSRAATALRVIGADGGLLDGAAIAAQAGGA